MKAPPQLWKVEMVKRPTACPDTPPETVARLSLRHTYMPKTPVDFAGPSYFGGKDDQLIMCAGKGGRLPLKQLIDEISTNMSIHVLAQPAIFISGIANLEHCCTISGHRWLAEI